ncbi:ATPase [Pseudomonas sp. CVAP|uniref:ATPase n=1 Tax=Pseudomonas sp. CVAP\|nr:ATPase [Pseudomonas sp. CVAP\
MKTNKRITRAYCVELEKKLSIVAARREYLSLVPPRERFTFLCTTEECRELDAKITGVNYDVNPQETTMSAHFRANPKDEHCPTCEWIEHGSSGDQDRSRPGETEEEATTRKAKRKLDDYIDIFDPSLKEKKPSGDRPGKGGDEIDGDGQGRGATRSTTEPNDKPRGPTKTTDLERLVESYRNAKSELSKEEFDLLTLQVSGYGVIPLRSYFRHITAANIGENGCVLFGGGTIKRYGEGFSFNFYDPLGEKRVSLYVPADQMNAYRYRRYLKELIIQADEVRYVTLYTLGHLEENPQGKGIDLKVEDLRQIALVLGPPKTQTETA